MKAITDALANSSESPDAEPSAAKDWPDGAPLHQHLADLALAAFARDGEAPCVVFRGARWSYDDIGGWSGAVAAAIRDRSGPLEGGAGRRVALLVERGPAIVAGLAGIAIAGGVAVPLDAAQPPERIQAMLADALPDLLLVEDAGAAERRWGLAAERLVDLGRLERKAPATEAIPPFRDGAGPAYLLYTSGSSGRPKGVVCNHHGLCNLIDDRLATTPLGAYTRLLLTTSISFDPAIYNVFLALRAGAALMIPDDATLHSGEALASLMRSEAVTFADMTPGLLATVPLGAFPALEMISLGGEVAPQRLVDAWAPRVRLENAYGPTETAVEVARWRWSAGEPGNRIGRPIANVRLRVVDESGTPSEEGELWIGGPMVALGYAGLPQLTAERFVTCPETGLRFYRSGDRVRRVALDVYDYLGRFDEQLKLAGMRIEPEEVRCALEAAPGVLEAAVAAEASEAGSPVLVGYYTAASPPPDRNALVAALSRRLPPAMIPARLVQVEAMPLTLSGKVDLAGLKRLAENARPAPAEAGEARSAVGRELAALWCKLLDLPSVRLSDNFFELGGDSLRLTQMIFTINRAHRVRLTPSAFRTLEDLGALVAYVEQARPPSDGGTGARA